MPVLIPSTAGDEAAPPGTEGLAARVAAGPGPWENEDWLADLRRESLLESLLAGRPGAGCGGRGRARSPAGPGR